MKCAHCQVTGTIGHELLMKKAGIIAGTTIQRWLALCADCLKKEAEKND